jgi:hypothetical protein
MLDAGEYGVSSGESRCQGSRTSRPALRDRRARAGVEGGGWSIPACSAQRPRAAASSTRSGPTSRASQARDTEVAVPLPDPAVVVRMGRATVGEGAVGIGPVVRRVVGRRSGWTDAPGGALGRDRGGRDVGRVLGGAVDAEGGAKSERELHGGPRGRLLRLTRVASVGERRHACIAPWMTVAAIRGDRTCVPFPQRRRT